MALLTGFTRPVTGDPILADGLSAFIAASIGRAVTVEIHPDGVDVAGSINEADSAAIQTAISNYTYTNSSGHDATKISMSALSNTVPMEDDPAKIITSHAALMADITVAATVNKSQASGLNTGTWPILRKAVTNASGVATIYLTADGTANAAASFSTVYEDGIVAMPVGPDNYQITGLVLSGDKKSLAVSLNKISSILGVITLSAGAGANIEVRAAVWGK